MKSNELVFLDEEQVRKCLRMADLITAMEKALIDFSAGKVTQPVRQVISVDPPGGFYGMMPARTPDGLGQKIVTFYPPNSDKGIPTHMALIVLNDPQTGAPLAVMDGRLITEMRAAVSAAATKLLASPNANLLAILGSGVQARSHVEALRLVRQFDEIRAWSPNKSHAESFAEEISAKTMSAEDAVCGADVVVTVTSSKTPVLQGKWLKAGCHVNAVGACRPDWRELDDDAMQNSVVFVDSREAAMKESGDAILSGARIYAELGEALAGKVPPHADKTTIFKSLGMAVEDVSAALLVYRATQASS
jgi:ornithine cyclodeaminase/alanine dehydrogenase-like protein (mu-crystallin family)